MTVSKRFLFVLEYTCCGKDAGHRIVRRIDRGRIYERLKDGSRLTHGVGRAVELVLKVIAAAYHGNDLARLGTNSNKRSVKVAGRLFREMFVEFLETGCYCLICNSLQIRIDRCINAEVLKRFRIADDLR